MKCLSVRQPWANIIAAGTKTIETRSWWTKYRGPLLIASCKKPAIEPAGKILAIVTLTACRLMSPRDKEAACCDYIPGWYSWVFSKIYKLQDPQPVKGSQGIYNVDWPAIAAARGVYVTATLEPFEPSLGPAWARWPE